MPHSLASRLSAVAPSITLAMNARAMELKARGVDVFAFAAGEPDFEPPQAVLDAAKKAIDDGSSKYTAVTGIPSAQGGHLHVDGEDARLEAGGRKTSASGGRQARALQPRARSLRAG